MLHAWPFQWHLSPCFLSVTYLEAAFNPEEAGKGLWKWGGGEEKQWLSSLKQMPKRKTDLIQSLFSILKGEKSKNKILV